MTVSKKKLFVKTFGCQMNVYDSVKMTDVLAPLGYAAVDSPDGADMVILNTCHIREKATEKVFSDLGRLKPHKDKKVADGENMILAVAGCVAQAEGAEIMRRAPYVDIVLGPQTYHRLPEMVARATRAAAGKGKNADWANGKGGAGILDTDFPVEAKFDHLPDVSNPQGATAMLTVQEGCDKFCTFCVVPYTRGSEFSRPVAQVVEEAKQLVAAGTREITLLGQNVNAYHGLAPSTSLPKGVIQQEWGLGRLVQELAEIDGLERIRYTTSHPRDMDDELIAAHRDVDKLMPYLHLPIQAGSNRILELMNRKHTVDEYMKIIDRLRAARPDLALSSDFIVGFPGETAKDFEDTLNVVNTVKYAQAFSFKYSPRPGTPAAVHETQVDEAEKAERLARLQDAIATHQAAFNHQQAGKTMPVLFDQKGQKPGQMKGRSPYLQVVNVNAPERLLGQLVDVKITQAFDNSLLGEVVTNEWDQSLSEPTQEPVILHG